MPRFYFCFSLLLSLLAPKVYAQTSKPISIVWEQNENNVKRDTLRSNLAFAGAYYDFDESKSPVFKRKIRLPENISTVNVSLEILDSIPFTLNEKLLLDTIGLSSTLTWNITYERKTPFLTIVYIPLTNTHKVLEFQYHLDLRYSEYDISSSKAIIQNSVLNDGDWYRFKVTEDGLYKFDKAAFEEMGVSISTINPTKIQVYGNGGAMLPEYNGDFRFDDLEENAVFVYGEDDGEFNSSDFVVFYAQSPHRWEYDTEALAFSHQLNIYDNTNYYYIHIGAEDGKRIESVNPVQNSNFEVDFHTHPTFYEWEDQNLKHSGRQWFGEYFSFNEQYNINFSFVDRIKTEPVRINARAVARSTSTTNLSCKLNGTEVLSVPIGVNISSEVYVDKGEAFSEFMSNQNSIGLSVSYDKNGNSAAFAYLDYIELQAKCALNYNGGQLLFKEPSTIGLNRASKFVINSNLNSFVVWDLTSPTEVTNISLSSFDSFSVSTETLKTFAIHDLNKSTYKKPLFDKKLQNQNLHGQATAELLIITAPEFLEAAERLAEYHINEDAMTVNVATTEQIYNEFSSGKQDIIALRDYVKMFYNRALSDEEIPENVLLFGDASFDYKGITAANGLYDDVNFVPTFQSEYSFKIGPSYCTDDFIAYLDTLEGAINTMSSDGMDVGVGRIVCQTLSEAEAVVDKIINQKKLEVKLNFSKYEKLAFIIDEKNSPKK